MNSELWQQEPDRWLLAHLLAAPSRSTRHRQGEWSRVARISGGRACVGRTNDRTTRSSAPLHADRRAERALPLPAGGRKKCARLENLRVPLFFRTDELQSAHSTDALPTVMAVRATVVSFTPVAHRGLAVRTSRAAVRGGESEHFVRGDDCPKNATSRGSPCAAACASMAGTYRHTFVTLVVTDVMRPHGLVACGARARLPPLRQ